MNYKIKSILQINTLLMNNNVKEQKINNDIVFLKNVLLVSTLNSYQAVNFMKNILSKNDLEDEYTLKIIIESKKDIQLMEQKDRLFKGLTMRNNQAFNNVDNKLKNGYKTKQQNYYLLSTFNVPFISHTMCALVYEIIKLSKETLDYHIIKIKYPQESESNVINIPK